MSESKQYEIPKRAVIEAYKRVKANKGSAGIDGIDVEAFEKNLNNNLYKIWNRMSSGSYFPSPVLAVEIPKKTGGTRTLGIPTIADRIAQMVARMYVEPVVEPMFCEDSYGYRPNKSAIDAVETARKRCWRYDYVIELDVKGLFDNIAEILNPLIRGWMNYFGKFNPSAMKGTLQCIERRIVKWAMCKYKNFRGRRRRAEKWLCTVRQREPKLFAHWSNLYLYC